MTNSEIEMQMSLRVKTERKVTREILELIQRAEHQRLPLELGFKDTYDWLIRGHGYSGGAAKRRGFYVSFQKLQAKWKMYR